MSSAADRRRRSRRKETDESLSSIAAMSNGYHSDKVSLLPAANGNGHSHPDDHSPEEQLEHGGGIKKDLGSIMLLLFLYMLQGIPLGLSASVPLILQNRHISYHQQALFSLAFWPFSLKLLWAPIVDSVFMQRIGRRKSWLVPTQYLIGTFMLIFSQHVHSVLGDDDPNAMPSVPWLTALFFALNFLAATQDIAVDGWALSMLSRANVGYASTCNAVGQTAGFFLGNAIFLSLESPEFCNAYLRSEPQEFGLVSLGDFVWFWAVVFLVSTTLVLIFKHEVDHRQKEGDITELDDLDVVSAYKLLWRIIKLKPVLTCCALMLTAKVAFAAGDGITGLKLIELGVPKDKLALMAIPLTPLQIALPWILSRYTAGPRPMNVFQRAYPFKVLSCLLLAAVVWYTPSWKGDDGHFPFMYFVLCIVVYCFHSIAGYSLYVSVMAFYAQVSDPMVGGTYMTLLNTVTNMGGNWPVTLALSATDDLTWKHCQFDSDAHVNASWTSIDCGVESVALSCVHSGGECSTDVDGYYVLIAIGFVFGIIWWRLTRNTIYKLQSEPKGSWACTVAAQRSRKPQGKM